MVRMISARMIGGMLLAGSVLLALAPARAVDDVERYTDGDALSGAKLYKRYCRGCHGEDGRGGAHTFMPHISNLTKKDYIELLPDSFLYEVIADGGEAVGKSAYMPAWKVKLSEQEIKDVIAHIRSMPTY
jgi:mono/diheme cytochrome c family protein